jgi:hypothetical protein
MQPLVDRWLRQPLYHEQSDQLNSVCLNGAAPDSPLCVVVLLCFMLPAATGSLLATTAPTPLQQNTIKSARLLAN